MNKVKKFSEFIDESVWSDMHKRSTGQTKKLEDIIVLDDRYKDKSNTCLKRFIEDIVYLEKYHNTLPDLKKFCQTNTDVKSWCDVIDGHTVHIYEILVPYYEDNWNKRDNIKRQIDELISEEEKKIYDLGFRKEPGKSICDTLDDWWGSLSDEKKDDILTDWFFEDAADEYYSEHGDDNEFTGEDLDPDEEWSRASWGTAIKIYVNEKE